jgi:hypothetical protein
MARALTQGPPGPCRVAGERAAPGSLAAAGPRGGRFDLTADRVPRKEVDPKAGLTHDLPGATFRLLGGGAYLKLSSVSADSAAEYIRRAAGTRFLIIDIRNYPSEFVVFALGQHLVERKTEFARFTYGDLANPGAFLWTEPIALKPVEPRYKGTVVILVDEVSQSQAEYTTMAFRSAPNASVVGSTTAGADGNISFIPLPGGLRAAISGIGVYYPDRRPTQQIGIVPDLVVRPTIEGIRVGREEVLEAVLRRLTGRNMRFILPREPP